MAITKDVAQWLFDTVLDKKHLEQEVAVYNIKDEFGDDFVYTNDNGNLAIEKKVLNAFNKLSGDKVVWSRGEKAWMPRQKFHSPDRQQD